MELRSARPGDGPGVLSLWRESEAHPSSTDDLASLDRLLTEHPGAVIVAEDDGNLVGSVIAGWDGWRGSIYRLAVAPSHRRQGLGRRLLEDAEARLASLGAVRLAAIVVGDDDQATSFWRAGDWEEQPERIRFVKDR